MTWHLGLKHLVLHIMAFLLIQWPCLADTWGELIFQSFPSAAPINDGNLSIQFQPPMKGLGDGSSPSTQDVLEGLFGHKKAPLNLTVSAQKTVDILGSVDLFEHLRHTPEVAQALTLLEQEMVKTSHRMDVVRPYSEIVAVLVALHHVERIAAVHFTVESPTIRGARFFLMASLAALMNKLVQQQYSIVSEQNPKDFRNSLQQAAQNPTNDSILEDLIPKEIRTSLRTVYKVVFQSLGVKVDPNWSTKIEQLVKTIFEDSFQESQHRRILEAKQNYEKHFDKKEITTYRTAIFWGLISLFAYGKILYPTWNWALETLNTGGFGQTVLAQWVIAISIMVAVGAYGGLSVLFYIYRQSRKADRRKRFDNAMTRIRGKMSRLLVGFARASQCEAALPSAQ